ADLVPPLLSLDAEVTLMSARGQRTLPLASYFVDYRTDVRRPDELITAIAWKRPPSARTTSSTSSHAAKAMRSRSQGWR
ncbi:MAG: FAD binding domain-containing protein, partial [Rhodoplanes sp.]